jgi:SAM-dependent methyltransferase
MPTFSSLRGRVTHSTPPLSPHAWLRFDAIERLLPEDAKTLLEIGAGLGSAGALIARKYEYTGLEPDRQSFETAVDRLASAGVVLQQDADSFEPSQPFDVVCAFEVLEHLPDDRAALRSWRRLVRPGGFLLVSVPAGRSRFGPTDVKAGHYRRYDRSDLVEALGSASFGEIEVIAYGFPLGYALEAGRNVLAARMERDASLEERTAGSGRWLQPPESAAAVMRLTSAPFRLVQRPFARSNLGTGFVARGRRAE